MSFSDKTITLITGPNRGIGNALIKVFLQRPNQLVIACVRDPRAAGAMALRELPQGAGTSLIVVKIDSSVETDPGAAVKELTSVHNIQRLDVAIANAAVGAYNGNLLTTSFEEVRSHMEVNVVGILALFQAIEPLLHKAPSPKLFLMSSKLSSMALLASSGPLGVLPYTMSKTVVNFLGRKIHTECEWLTTVLLNPGWVQTELGQYCATVLGVEEPPVTLDASCQGLVKVVSSDTSVCNGISIDIID